MDPRPAPVVVERAELEGLMRERRELFWLGALFGFIVGSLAMYVLMLYR